MNRSLVVLTLLVAGAVVLLLPVSQTDRGPFERAPLGMEAVYWSVAVQATSSSGSMPLPPGMANRIYPELLSFMASTDPGAVAQARRLLTLVSLPLFAVLVLILAWRRAGPWPAVVSAIATLAAGPLVLTAGTMTPAVPAALILLLALVVLDARRARIYSWGLAGILIGLAGRFDATLAWVLLVLLLAGALIRPPGKRRLPPPAALAGGFLAALILTTLAGDTLPLLPRISGIEMYRGHRARASGVEPRRGDADSLKWWGSIDYVRAASREESRMLSYPEADAWWAARVPGEAFGHPVPGARRTAIKALASFQGDPLPRGVSAEFLRDRTDSWGLGLVLWVGRILIPLGLVGLLLAWRRTGWVLGAAALSGFGAALVTYAAPDARILTVCAAMAGLGLWVERMTRGSARTRVLGLAGGAAAVGILGFLPPAGGTPGMRISGDDHLHLGTVFEQEQRGSAAIREYERALRLDPANPFPHLAIARMLAADNVNQEAILELERLRERYPRFVPGLVGLTRLYEAEEEWRNATTIYADLIREEPWNPEHWNNLGTMYVQLGLYDQAVRAFEEALRLSPTYQTARGNLQSLRDRGLAPGLPAGADSLRIAQEEILTRLRAGRREEAESLLEAAYERFGRDNPGLRFVEGTVHLVSGEPGRAVTIFEGLRSTMGSNIILLNNLGAAYREMGNREKAIATYEEALRLQPSNERVRVALEELRAESEDSTDSGR